MIHRALLLLALAGVAAAQDLTPKAPPQAGPILITGATLHAVSRAPAPGWLLFDGGRIVDFGADERAFDEKIERLDATGLHVYPGLVSSFTRLGLVEIGAVRASRDTNEVGQLTPEARAAVAVNPDSTLIPVTRSNGILTFATFPAGGDIPGRLSVLNVDGWTWEDMALRADAGLVVSWPVPRARPPRADRPRPRRRPEPPPFAERLTRIKAAFAQARAYLAARAEDSALPVDVRWEAMRGVLERKTPVFFTADDYDQIVSAVWFAARQRVRAVIVGGRDAPQCADHLKRHDIAVVVTAVHRFPKRRDSDYDEAYRLPARLEAAGVRWCLASGERTANERNLPYTAARAVAYGLAPDVALEAITLRAATILGVGDRLGSLDKGKLATLIVTDGNPLEVTTQVRHAFVAGRRLDLSNKQIRLREKYLRKYRELGLIR